MTILIFANPIAGKGRGKRIAQTLQRRLSADGHEVRVFLDRATDVPKEQMRTAHQPSAAISIGGDGTLRGVAEHLMSVFAADEMPPILFVPLGTANLMGRHLRVDWTSQSFTEQVSRALQTRRVVHLDAASANGRLFLLMAGVGIDGAIVHELDRVRKGPIDYLSYALPAALALVEYKYPSLRVVADDVEVFASAPAMAWIGNVPEYGTGFPILPDARSDDGLLDVCVLPCRSRKDALSMLLRAAAKEHLQMEGVVYTKATRVRIDSPESVPVQVDGEAAGHTPLDVRLLPVRVPFIVPG